jgi:hypothetical protein
MSQSAVKYAQDYAWEKITGQIVDVYRDLLAHKDSTITALAEGQISPSRIGSDRDI